MTEGSFARRTASGVAWTALERWGSRALTLVVFAVLGRLLTAADFGLVAIMTAILALIAVFVDYGFAQALVQRPRLTSTDTHTAFWMSLGAGVILYTLVCGLSPLIASAYGEPLLGALVPVGALVLVFSGLSSVPAATLQRDLSFRALTIRQLGGSVVGAIVALAMAFSGLGIWALVVQPVAAAAAATVILWVTVRWVPRFEFSWVSLKEIWPFSLQVISIEFVNAMQANVDKFIVGAFFTPSQLGFYFVAQRVLTILIEVVSSVLSKVSLPALSRVQNDHDRFLSYFYTLTFAGASIAFPAFALFAAFGESFTALLFGDGWSASVPLLMLLAPSAALAAVTVFDKSALLAKGRGGASLSVAVGQFVFGVAVLIAAVPLGLAAVAAGRSIRQFAYWPVRIFALRKFAGISAAAYLRQFISPTLGSILLVAVCVGLQYTPWADAPLPIVSFVLPVSIIALGVYVATLAIIERGRIRRIVRVLRPARSDPAR